MTSNKSHSYPANVSATRITTAERTEARNISYITLVQSSSHFQCIQTDTEIYETEDIQKNTKSIQNIVALLECHAPSFAYLNLHFEFVFDGLTTSTKQI